jgi:drug/metabolite transporter (DMT)-like permease
MVSPKLLLIVGGVVMLVATAIAIFMAVSYTPTSTTPSSTVTSTR